MRIKIVKIPKHDPVAARVGTRKLSKAIAEDAYTRSIKSVSPDGLGKESAIKRPRART